MDQLKHERPTVLPLGARPELAELEEAGKVATEYLDRKAEELRTGYDPAKCQIINTNIQDVMINISDKMKGMDLTEEVKCPECKHAFPAETVTQLSKAIGAIVKVPDVLVKLRPVAEATLPQEDAGRINDVESVKWMEDLTEEAHSEVVLAMTVIERWRQTVIPDAPTYDDVGRRGRPCGQSSPVGPHPGDAQSQPVDAFGQKLSSSLTGRHGSHTAT